MFKRQAYKKTGASSSGFLLPILSHFSLHIYIVCYNCLN
jgi:hypothetical protein